MVVRQFERPDISGNAAGHLIERRAIGGDRVPHTDEVDLVHRPIVGLIVILRQEQVAKRAEEILDVPDRMIPLPAVLAVGGTRLPVELGLIVRLHQALIDDQAHDNTDRERAAAESKAVQFFVVFAIVAAGEFVEGDDVALQAETERAAEDRHRLERRGADAVVIKRDLVVAGKIQRIERAPDIGAPDFRRRITRAVGQQNDFSAHRIAP